MRARYFIYVFSAFACIAFYSVFFSLYSGFRLPFYYSPDGSIIHLGIRAAPERPLKIYSISGEKLKQGQPFFKEKEAASLLLVTDRGKEEVRTVFKDKRVLFLDFQYLIFSSLLFLFCGLWFFFNTRDFYHSFLNFNFSVFSALSVLVLSSHQYIFAWYCSLLLLAPSLLNVTLRLTKRYIPVLLLATEFFVLLFFTLLFYTAQDELRNISYLARSLLPMHGLILLSVFYFMLAHVMKKTGDRVEARKRWILFIGTCFGLILPFVLLCLRLADVFPYPILPYFFLGLIFFSLALFYGSYRLQLLPFQIVVSQSLLLLLQVLIFSCIYASLLFLQKSLLPSITYKEEWLFQALFILILIVFLDPVRYSLALRFGANKFYSDAKLEQSVRKMMSLLISRRKIQRAVSSCIEEIRRTLDLQKLDLLLPENIFPELSLPKKNITRIASQSGFWQHLKDSKTIVVDYLRRSGRAHQDIFSFLFKGDYMLAVGARAQKRMFQKSDHKQRIKAALLVGHRHDYKILSMNEVHYLREAALIMYMLIESYQTLMEEIALRQRIRELQIAGQLQKNLPQAAGNEIKGISFAYSSKAALAVSGDYFDFIERKPNKVYCFLGDVSGHGLGMGYLASSVRSIVRAYLKQGASLDETAGSINRFFLDRYYGSEFFTLAACLIDTEKMELEYLIAAHPGPYLLQAKTGELVHLKSFHILLGVVPTSYQVKRIKLHPGDRLFLYSDGVTEAFNPENTAYGENRLKSFLKENRRLALQDMITGLQNELRSFRSGAPITDDTTVAAVEIKKGGSFAKIFSNIRFG